MQQKLQGATQQKYTTPSSTQAFDFWIRISSKHTNITDITFLFHFNAFFVAVHSEMELKKHFRKICETPRCLIAIVQLLIENQKLFVKKPPVSKRQQTTAGSFFTSQFDSQPTSFNCVFFHSIRFALTLCNKNMQAGRCVRVKSYSSTSPGFDCIVT